MQVRIPPVFWQFARYWRLPERLTRLWWQALSQSRYSQPTALRQAWLLWDGAPIADPTSVVQQTSAPAQTPPVDAIPQCLTHGALKKSTKGKGWYCPHRLDDDTWCPSKAK